MPDKDSDPTRNFNVAAPLTYAESTCSQCSPETATVKPAFRLTFAHSGETVAADTVALRVAEQKRIFYSQGVGFNDVVMVPADKSFWMYIEVLALVQIGATYVMVALRS